jgi:hypothetical protein
MKNRFKLYVILITLFLTCSANTVNHVERKNTVKFTETEVFIINYHKVVKKYKLSNNFINKLLIVSKKLETKPTLLLASMIIESEMKAHSVNNVSGAVGLLGFTDITCKQFKWNKHQIKKLSRMEQLDYVYSYYKRFKGRLNSIADYGIANAAPSCMFADKRIIVYSDKTDSYWQNTYWDLDNNGVIQVWEIGSHYSNRPNKFVKYLIA